MAAILPFLERQDDPAETDEQEDALGQTPEHTLGALRGLGKVGASPECFVEASRNPDALDQAHTQLLQTAWQREAVREILSRGRFQAQIRNIKGTTPGKVFLVLDQPIGALLRGGEMSWSPVTDGRIQQVEILSWTSKMGAPSFSLPAGSPSIGGSCPGSIAGQSINSLAQLRVNACHVTKQTGLPVHLDRAICQHCYAEGGQYSTANVQIAQVLRLAWAQKAIADGSFVEVLSYAIANANFKLKGGQVTVDVVDPNDPEKIIKEKSYIGPENHPGRYFRLHDSGDFFRPEYLEAWCHVAAAFPDILFWAPTRIWATSWGMETVDRLGRTIMPGNLILRPSAFHTNEPPPSLRGPGWAAGTSVYSARVDEDTGVSPKDAGWEQRAFDWDCGVYAIEDAKATCRLAVDPTGRVGCRACWRYPQVVVNYTLH